jgi:ribosomal protein S27E
VFWGCRERSWLFSHSQFEYDCKSEGWRWWQLI